MAYAATQGDLEQELMQLVGFTIGNSQFGVDILMVQEIIRGAPVTSIPSAPNFVEGVINLRGNILPVIDLRKRLNLYGERPLQIKNWVLLLDIKGKITGFLVDSVTEVLKVPKDQLEPAPELVMDGLKSQYLQGVCDIGPQLLIILDFNRILLQEELQKLKAMETER